MSKTYEFVIPASFAGSACVCRPSKNSLAATAPSLLVSSVRDGTVPARPRPRRPGAGRAGRAAGARAAVPLERAVRRPAAAQPLALDADAGDLVGERLDRARAARLHLT